MILRALKAGLLVIALATVVFASLFRISATFDVIAETEHVVFVPEIEPVQHWELDSVNMFGRDDSISVTVSGALEFIDSVQVTVERRSQGPLVLKIEPTAQRQQADGDSPIRVGVLRERSGTTRELYDHVIVEIPDVGERAQRGKPTVFAVRGTLQIGRTIQREPDAYLALLRAGKVTKFVRSLVDSTAIMVGSHDLDLGDEVTIDQPSSPELGLVRVDERAALSVAYRADSRSVRVQRPGGGYYRIRAYPYERAIADPVLQGVWGLLIILYGILTSVEVFFPLRPAARATDADL